MTEDLTSVFFDELSTGLADEGLFKQFQSKYWLNPSGFVQDCIDWDSGNPFDSPADYQLDVLDDLIKYHRVSVRGLHGLGKTTVASWVVHWFALTRADRNWMIPTTASSWIQLTKYLWPEIHKWAHRLRWDLIGRKPYHERKELLMNNLRLGEGQAFAVSHKDEEKMEGAHADYMLYLFDEAKSLSDGIFDAAEGAMSTQVEGSGREVFALSISTPGEPLGRFYEIQSQKPGFEDWHVIRVTKEMAIKAGRVSEKWCEQRRKQWGENSAIYINRVLGDFAAQDENSVIPTAWVELANDHWLEWKDEEFDGLYTSLGVDVGGGLPGADKTTIAKTKNGVRVREIERLQTGDPKTWTSHVVGRVHSLLRTYQYAAAYIDVIGIGAGVYHGVMEKKDVAFPFIANKRTNLLDMTGEWHFVDWRSAAWWLLREMLDPSNEEMQELGIVVCLPIDDELIGELTAPTYWAVSDGKIKVESKAQIKARLHRSTDVADAVIQAIAGPILINAMEQEEKEQYSIDYNPPTISLFGR